jgi:hypothetical protein
MGWVGSASADDGGVDGLARWAGALSGTSHGSGRVGDDWGLRLGSRNRSSGCGRVVRGGCWVAGCVHGGGEPGCVVGVACAGGDGGGAGDEFRSRLGCGVGYCCDGGDVGGLGRLAA